MDGAVIATTILSAYPTVGVSLIGGGGWFIYRKRQKDKTRRALAGLQEFLTPLSNLLIAHKSKLSTLQGQTTVCITPPLQPVAPRPTTWGYLIFNTGNQAALSGSRVLVGRAESGNTKPGVDLTSLPESTTVSRIHTAIEYDGSNCTVTDLDSTNSTYINGKRLEPKRPSHIIDGDILNFGKVSCTFKRT